MSYYDLSPAQKRMVEIGREISILAEEHMIYKDNDELWNAALTVGQKLCSVGSIWSRFKDINDLNVHEKTVLREYLNKSK